MTSAKSHEVAARIAASAARCAIDPWLHRFQTGEGTLFELDKALAVGRAAFREDENRASLTLLGALLSVLDDLENAPALVLVASVEEDTADGCRDGTNRGYSLDTVLGDEARHGPHEQERAENVVPALMVGHHHRCSLVVGLPVRAQPLAVVNFGA
eukprot:CAMPEP_0185580220 /NCGR_PEP_ID=MMETSP0434-20130131/15747_1 /TAXON_ID=626734 ORGANISM="Favella taraikaensis, Strain Fe Narragansett Bay" /NCGR_SAMPLE_ID=MMETSP0434 /ASSEMBLY_ACC=CAM_ASM_000379 /LENGTH=155 /DNA_ID=CAMNT_0028198417 /DNA_START=322 /DNA_END=790 /DNA_ORIENTATION=+